jgi:hypothetical protein
MQMKIVHRPNTQDALCREPRADAIHKGATRSTEMIRHGVSRLDGMGLTEDFQILASAKVPQVRIGDGEVGGEH